MSERQRANQAAQRRANAIAERSEAIAMSERERANQAAQRRANAIAERSEAIA